ncbi:transcription antitermination factor NusB [Trichothermofontia sp.]
MKARQISRELALLALSQLPASPDRLAKQELQNLVLAAVRTLTAEAHEALETAAMELDRGHQQLLKSETQAAQVESARVMIQAAIEQVQTALNRLGSAIDFPERIQLANQTNVRAYALEILERLQANRAEIDAILEASLVDWQVQRLVRIDRDLLRIAITEMLYLGTSERIAINEAVELAKLYGDEDGHRFINGVLRRVVQQIQSRPPVGSVPTVTSDG